MKHVLKTRAGMRAQVRIHGQLYRKHFPRGTPQHVISRWLYEQQAAHRGEPRMPNSGKLSDDARTYLAAVAAMPTFHERRRHIEAWVEAFGARQRGSLTPADISTQLHTWRQSKAASTCNHLRTALGHLFTRLDGRSARNPVRDVPKFPEPRPAPRALSQRDIRRVLDAMGDTASRARLEVMAATGLPARQVAQLTPSDVDLRSRVVTVVGRAKGAGSHGRALPLSRDAVSAFQRFARANAWGTFSNSSLGKAFKRATKLTLGRDDLSPYVLRHSFATAVYAATGDLHAVGQLLLHSNPTLTARYAAAAVPSRLRAAVDSTNNSTNSPRRSQSNNDKSIKTNNLHSRARSSAG
ncbi:MAG: tyrosine-type recombinase/integrase [Rhodospirillaceae bacterium]